LSIASLAWQAWSFYLSGAVVAVSTHVARPNHGFGLPPGAPLPVAVSATNHGRLAVEIKDWGYTTGDPRTAPTMRQIVGLPTSDPIPGVLEPGRSFSWFLPRHQAINACQDLLNSDPRKIRAFVELGTGRSVRAQARGIGLSGGRPALSRAKAAALTLILLTSAGTVVLLMV
jgi:hypothetical protein